MDSKCVSEVKTLTWAKYQVDPDVSSRKLAYKSSGGGRSNTRSGWQTQIPTRWKLDAC